MTPYYETSLGKLYHGDCLDIMPQLEPVDLVLTDPPYGLGDRMKDDAGEWAKGFHEAPEWDNETVCNDLVLFAIKMANHAIIWGGNYYDLPPMRGWLSWDKKQSHTSGHFELAWTTLDIPTRNYRLSRVEAYSRMNKEHPTQKPTGLFVWCIELAGDVGNVLDPFLGSGTTAVACERLKRRWIGIEISEEYCEIAAKRIGRETSQLKLF